MKDYKEMAESVFRRMEEYEEKRIQRRKTVQVAALICACMAVLVGVGVWQWAPGSNAPGAVFIPAIDLPCTPSDSADMIGLAVYKGAVYTQSEVYYGEDARRLSGLVGDHLGQGTGTIHEWSTQEAYAQEFASNFSCGIYSVKGYSTDFRLCAAEFGSDGTAEYIQFLDCLNGIALPDGRALFDQRLNLQGRVTAVRYQTHEDWNQENANYQDAALTQEQLDAFLEALCAGPFVYTYKTDPDIYDAGEQVHLYLQLDDGTTPELRLMEGGFVGYQPLGWYFVKMPGDAFNAVFAMCK